MLYYISVRNSNALNCLCQAKLDFDLRKGGSLADKGDYLFEFSLPADSVQGKTMHENKENGSIGHFENQMSLEPTLDEGLDQPSRQALFGTLCRQINNVIKNQLLELLNNATREEVSVMLKSQL
jgi:hypothetical protein